MIFGLTLLTWYSSQSISSTLATQSMQTTLRLVSVKPDNLKIPYKNTQECKLERSIT